MLPKAAQIEVHSKDEKYFSVTRIGSRGTFVVSWQAWCCEELALLMLTLLHAWCIPQCQLKRSIIQDLVEWNQVSTPSYATGCSC